MKTEFSFYVFFFFFFFFSIFLYFFILSIFYFFIIFIFLYLSYLGVFISFYPPLIWYFIKKMLDFFHGWIFVHKLFWDQILVAKKVKHGTARVFKIIRRSLKRFTLRSRARIWFRSSGMKIVTTSQDSRTKLSTISLRNNACIIVICFFDDATHDVTRIKKKKKHFF